MSRMYSSSLLLLAMESHAYDKNIAYLEAEQVLADCRIVLFANLIGSLGFQKMRLEVDLEALPAVGSQPAHGTALATLPEHPQLLEHSLRATL